MVVYSAIYDASSAAVGAIDGARMAGVRKADGRVLVKMHVLDEAGACEDADCDFCAAEGTDV
jgi:hypothetical protein